MTCTVQCRMETCRWELSRGQLVGSHNATSGTRSQSSPFPGWWCAPNNQGETHATCILHAYADSFSATCERFSSNTRRMFQHVKARRRGGCSAPGWDRGWLTMGLSMRRLWCYPADRLHLMTRRFVTDTVSHGAPSRRRLSLAAGNYLPCLCGLCGARRSRGASNSLPRAAQPFSCKLGFVSRLSGKGRQVPECRVCRRPESCTELGTRVSLRQRVVFRSGPP
jgi:hypothetical protein